MWQVVQVLADNVEQTRLIREYCERPIPLSGPHLAGPQLPPPTYEPSLPRQLHLQTAIPHRGPPAHTPQVQIDLGEGRNINIPLSRGHP